MASRGTYDHGPGSSWYRKRWGSRLSPGKAAAAAKARVLAYREPLRGLTLSATVLDESGPVSPALFARLTDELVPAFPPGGLPWEDAVEESWWRCERTRFPMVPAGDPRAYVAPS